MKLVEQSEEQLAVGFWDWKPKIHPSQDDMARKHNGHRTDDGIKRATLAFLSKTEAGFGGFEEDFDVPSAGVQ